MKKMTTNPATTETILANPATAEPVATTPKPAKEKRSFSVGLTGADGAALRVVAAARKDGTAVTFAVHSTGPKVKGQRKNVRGATKQHASLDLARAAVERLVAAAIKGGWTRPTAAVGFKAREDAFDESSLPSPNAKPAKSKKAAA
jgi:hypothetical protein